MMPKLPPRFQAILSRVDRSYLIAGLITLAAILWIVSGQFGKDAAPSASPATQAAQEASLPTVRVSRLTARPMVREVTLQGRTVAERSVEVRAEVRGQVAEILAARGTRVEQGAPLVRLDVADREAKLAEARARVAQREAQHKAAQSLTQKGFNSEIALAEAKANLDEARAELRDAELNLKRTTIQAPYTGILNERTVEIGDVVEVNAPVAQVIDLDPIRIVGFVSERDVTQINTGGKAVGTILGGQKVEGRISYVSAMAQPETRTFRVEVEVPNPDAGIREGLTAQMRLPVAERMAHLVSPSVLTLDDQGAVGVKIVDADQKVQFVPVRIVGSEAASDAAPATGPASVLGAGLVWIEGLPETISLITTGQDFVIAGQRVQPVAAEGNL